MKIDITVCRNVNIVDSCAVSNILSSVILYNRLDTNGFHFSITKYVEYECLYKARSFPDEDKEIRNRLVLCQKKTKFLSHQISIDDLQDPLILKYSPRLGRGELSSIVFSKKINQPFLTDDQKARKIAIKILGVEMVQTTPQLAGWLFYKGVFTDGDLNVIIDEHKKYNRPLEIYFKEVYYEALRIRSMEGN